MHGVDKCALTAGARKPLSVRPSVYLSVPLGVCLSVCPWSHGLFVRALCKDCAAPPCVKQDVYAVEDPS